MKTFLEKFSLLSLSLMLVSTLSPSTALPQMITTFHQQGYAARGGISIFTIIFCDSCHVVTKSNYRTSNL